VVEKAEAVVRIIIETYFAPNKTFPELRELMDSHAIESLRAFSEMCRAELQALKAPIATACCSGPASRLIQQVTVP
jgi:hypothetical protein